MRRTAALVTALAAALVLGACSAPAPHSEPGDSDHEESTPAPSARQGWRIGATNVLGEWQPRDVCGGDYVFVRGFGLMLLEDLIDLEGNAVNEGPSLYVRDIDGWEYYWNSNAGFGEQQPGDYLDGGKKFDFAPDAAGHPPATLTITGGYNRTVNDALAWTTHRGADSITLTFSRVPEPEWCLEDEEYAQSVADEDPDWVWRYYD